MTWNTTRRERLPSNWSTIRRQVLERDGNRCCWITLNLDGRPVRCTSPATDVDHIRRGDDHSLDNLQSLCNHHHLVKTQGESVAAKKEIQQRFRRKPEEHPGLAWGNKPL